MISIWNRRLRCLFNTFSIHLSYTWPQKKWWWLCGREFRSRNTARRPIRIRKVKSWIICHLMKLFAPTSISTGHPLYRTSTSARLAGFPDNVKSVLFIHQVLDFLYLHILDQPIGQQICCNLYIYSDVYMHQWGTVSEKIANKKLKVIVAIHWRCVLDS